MFRQRCLLQQKKFLTYLLQNNYPAINMFFPYAENERYVNLFVINWVEGLMSCNEVT